MLLGIEEEVLPDELPVKLPPDITVVKEVVPASDTSTPVKRRRGRPRQTDTIPPPAVQSQKKDTTPNSEKSFSCSICPRSFNTDFVSILFFSQSNGCADHSQGCKIKLPIAPLQTKIEYILRKDLKN